MWNQNQQWTPKKSSSTEIDSLWSGLDYKMFTRKCCHYMFWLNWPYSGASNVKKIAVLRLWCLLTLRLILVLFMCACLCGLFCSALCVCVCVHRCVLVCFF
jgi:hypothetical protein